MTLSRIISDISWWWRKVHPPMAADRAWKAASEAEKRARRRGCTKAIGAARKAQRNAVLSALAGRDWRAVR